MKIAVEVLVNVRCGHPIDLKWKDVVQTYVFMHEGALIRPLSHLGAHEDGEHLIFKADKLEHWFHARYCVDYIIAKFFLWISRKRKATAVPVDGGDGVPSTSAGTTTPKKARKTTTKQTPEKRLARYISSPSIAVKERIQRAFEHRLYLIEQRMINVGQGSPKGCEFFVLGATGNVYTVILETKPSCTCPDAARGNTCKHFLFVMLRVLKLPQSDARVWQKAYLSSELEDLLNISATNEGVLASQSVRQRFLEIAGMFALIHLCLHFLNLYGTRYYFHSSRFNTL